MYGINSGIGAAHVHRHFSGVACNFYTFFFGAVFVCSNFNIDEIVCLRLPPNTTRTTNSNRFAHQFIYFHEITLCARLVDPITQFTEGICDLPGTNNWLVFVFVFSPLNRQPIYYDFVRPVLLRLINRWFICSDLKINFTSCIQNWSIS